MKKIISVLLCLAMLFSFCAFAAAKAAPQLNLDTTKMSAGADYFEPGQYVSFRFLLKNCPDFESFRVRITYNPEVLEVYYDYPFDLEQIMRNSISITKESDGVVVVDGLKYEEAFKCDFDPFCFKVIGCGDTDISAELVSFKIADGEVENVVFNASIYNFTTFVRYDLDGDGRITAEDARLALRFAVGLDTATDEQCRAVGVRAADSFTAADARFILRAAVGLEGDAEKVVVNMEWVADSDTAYLVYHYSDGSYKVIGPLDAKSDRPDWL